MPALFKLYRQALLRVLSQEDFGWLKKFCGTYSPPPPQKKTAIVLTFSFYFLFLTHFTQVQVSSLNQAMKQSAYMLFYSQNESSIVSQTPTPPSSPLITSSSALLLRPKLHLSRPDDSNILTLNGPTTSFVEQSIPSIKKRLLPLCNSPFKSKPHSLTSSMTSIIKESKPHRMKESQSTFQDRGKVLERTPQTSNNGSPIRTPKQFPGISNLSNPDPALFNSTQLLPPRLFTSQALNSKLSPPFLAPMSSSGKNQSPISTPIASVLVPEIHNPSHFPHTVRNSLFPNHVITSPYSLTSLSASIPAQSRSPSSKSQLSPSSNRPTLIREPSKSLPVPPIIETKKESHPVLPTLSLSLASCPVPRISDDITLPWDGDAESRRRMMKSLDERIPSPQSSINHLRHGMSLQGRVDIIG